MDYMDKLISSTWWSIFLWTAVH